MPNTTYLIERLDESGWTIVGSDPVSGWAQHYMRAKRRMFPSYAFRVVELPSRRLVVCEGGPALSGVEG